jgi:hypothetical protein
LKKGPLAGSTVKVLHVCRNCLEKLKSDEELARKYRIRYYKMPILGHRCLG